MSEDIVKESIKCLANMEIKETTYQVARSVVLDEIERLKSIIKEVREYIEINLLKDDNGCGCWWYSFGDYNEAKYELLEILDKENK